MHLRRAVGERPVDDVRVAGHPADVGGAPVDVGLRLEVEDGVVGVRDLGEVAAGGVQDALRLTGGARGVEDEERVLGVERLGRVLGRSAARRSRATTRRGPRSRRSSWPVRRTTRTLLDVLRAGPGQRLVDGGLERGRLAAAVAAVGGDDHAWRRRPGCGWRARRRRSRRRPPSARRRCGRRPASRRPPRGSSAGRWRPGRPSATPSSVSALAALETSSLELGVGDGAGVARLALEVDGDPVAVARSRRAGPRSCTRR